MSPNKSVYYCFYEAPQGVGAVIFDHDGLIDLMLPRPDSNKTKEVLEQYPQSKLMKRDLSEVTTSLNSYFRGQKTGFGCPLNFNGYTLFEREVFAVTQTIPYGDVRSYKWVAERAGKPRAMRAVGQALKKNRVPVIIPCHRVVRSDGTLGGFNAGVSWKKRLLELEAKE